jgi:acetate kinase
MAILVLNLGSSSLKAALFEPSSLKQLWAASTSFDAAAGPTALLNSWLAPQLEAWWPQIQQVGHRVVHGGERFSKPTRLTAEALRELEALGELAPLHNPPALAAIQWVQSQQPQLPQWACFDTAFHASLPAASHSYALPASWRQQGLRRFGFHGINHQHLAEQAALIWRKQGHAAPPKLISCHLGAGCSLAAITDGRSIDTTMGFTPLEGLVMASRSGTVDPGLLLHQLRRGISGEDLDQVLNHESGLLGLSGLSSDWRELKHAAAKGHAGAQLALAVFIHRLKAGIAAMAASLGGVDLIALSGGIGAHDRELLEQLQRELAWIGPVQWVQLPADEERMIARLIRQEGFSDPEDQGSDATGGSGAGDRR